MPAASPDNATTVQNLLAAFEGESNAHARYTAFAVQAGAEGWHGAASLFRAAARSEQIHAANHARVIKQLGGEAQCLLHAVAVKTTLENLKAALGGVQYEIAAMYPGFLEEAEARKNTAAIHAFTGGSGSGESPRAALRRSHCSTRWREKGLLDRRGAGVLRLPGLRLHLGDRRGARTLPGLQLPLGAL